MNKKEHLLLSAIDTFVEHGSQGSSMNLIAKNAKLPVGSLYTYFCSKEELLNKIYLFIKANEIDFILKKYDDTKSVKKRFFSFYTQFIHFFIKHPNQLKFIQLYIYSPEINLKTREKGLKLFEVLFSIFEDGIAQNIMKNHGRDDLCFYSCGSINSTILYKMTAKKTINKQEISDLVQLTWDALKK